MNNLITKERFDKVFKMIDLSTAKGKVFPAESKLRQSLPLVNGQSTYQFNPKAISQVIGDKALDRNDLFVISRWGLLLSFHKNGAPQVQRHFTHVPVNDGSNPSIFPVGFTNDNAEAIYNGTLQYVVDNGVLLDSYALEKFRKIPETQGLFVLDADGNAVQEGIQEQWSLDKALELLIPRIMIAGTRDTKINVNFDAAGLTFPCTEGYTPYLTLFMDGFLIKGGCEYFEGANAFSSIVGQW